MITLCKICNKEIYVRPAHFKRGNGQYCSLVCRGISQTEKGNPNWKENQKTCLFCSQLYKPHIGKGGEKFCSAHCMGKYKSKNHSIYRNCIVCEKIIHVINAILKTKTTCSRSCASILHSRRMKAKGNSNWRGGIGKLPYSYEFTSDMKQQIKQRDNYTCQICGRNEKELPIRKGYALMIHHIDYNKQNCSMNNLITVCPDCHGKTGYNRKEWNEQLSKRL